MVNRAEALKRGVTHRRQTAFVGKVHGDNGRARFAEITLDLLARRFASHGQDDGRARIQCRVGNAPADLPGCAGDNDDFAGEC